MTAYTVYLEQLPPLLDEWSRHMEVHVPVRLHNGFFDFAPYDRDVDIAWDYDVAYNSPKRFLLPPREDLIRFDAESYKAEPVFEAPDQLIFGIHPYDLRAINQLDQLLESGAPDQNYRRRREKTLLFALSPMSVSPTAFWTTMGADKVDIGFDLYFTRVSPSAFHVEVLSPKGEEMLLAKGELEQATLAERETARRERRRIATQANANRLAFDWHETPKLLARNWDSQIWRNRSRNCLSCGSCVMVCPTCYCFEMREEMDLVMKKGARFREWDGCMLPAFALVAGGHNFRGDAMERYRHRYFRKGLYIFEKIGELGCIGCGRCVRACTAGIANPLEIYNELWEAENHEL